MTATTDALIDVAILGVTVGVVSKAIQAFNHPQKKTKAKKSKDIDFFGF